jgi:hypothetical protein
MTPHPIDTMPTADLAEEALAFLYCPEQGGWHTAVFFEQRWVDVATMTLELEPTHVASSPQRSPSRGASFAPRSP